MFASIKQKKERILNASINKSFVLAEPNGKSDLESAEIFLRKYKHSGVSRERFLQQWFLVWERLLHWGSTYSWNGKRPSVCLLIAHWCNERRTSHKTRPLFSSVWFKPDFIRPEQSNDIVRANVDALEIIRTTAQAAWKIY